MKCPGCPSPLSDPELSLSQTLKPLNPETNTWQLLGAEAQCTLLIYDSRELQVHLIGNGPWQSISHMLVFEIIFPASSRVLTGQSTEHSHFSQESIASNPCFSTFFSLTLLPNSKTTPHKFRCILSITSLLARKFLLISYRNNYHLAVQRTHIYYLLVLEIENPKSASLGWNQRVLRVLIL